jgi:prepilin-type N-terminal cleavage/methylation domain-containing protein
VQRRAVRPGEAGVTLVELLVAAAIIGVALIPLLQMVPGTLGPAQVSDVHLRLETAAVRKTEELIGRLRANIAGVASGAEACADFANCRLVWTIATEASSPAPGVGALVRLSTVACVDSNGSGACDAGEEQVRLDTKVTSRP